MSFKHIILFNEIKLPSDVQFMKLSNISLSLICYIRDLLEIEQKFILHQKHFMVLLLSGVPSNNYQKVYKS